VIRCGATVPGRDCERALQELAEQRAEVDAVLERGGIDMVLAPAATDVAPAGISSTGDPAMSMPWSRLGLPCVSLPLPRAAGGLPLGFQLIGRRHASVLRWAGQVAVALAARESHQ
jgi:Asp-tRNA(Asn)/Glu-tRNA(Gln) amidotransferase A subunit family amidase